MDKEKIKGQANIDIFNLRMAQKQGVITEFGKGKLEALEGIVDFIDSLHEEPVKDRFAFKAIPRLLEMIEPTDKAKSYVTKLADAFDSEGYYTDAKIVRNRLKIMNGEKVPMATMDEEPVSDDLGKAAEQDVCEVINTCSASGIPNDHIPSWVQDAMINEFIHGAKWKEQQFEKERLKHCDALTEEQAQMESDFVVDFIKKNKRTPTFIDAIEYGIKLKLKEENKL